MDEVEVVRVGLDTICFRPSLSSMDRRMLSRGCLDEDERSMLMSPKSMKDNSDGGDSCSRADSTLRSTEVSDEGSRYRMPHNMGDRFEWRRSSTTRSSAVA